MIQSQVTITYQSQFVVMPVLAGYLSEHVCSAIMQITPDDRRSVAKAKGNLAGSQALQARSSIWCLTNCGLLPRCTCTDRLADDDQSGSDPDAHLQRLQANAGLTYCVDDR